MSRHFKKFILSVEVDIFMSQTVALSLKFDPSPSCFQNKASAAWFSPFHFSCPSKSGSFGHNYITSFFDRERESCVTSKKAVVQQVTKLFGIYDSKLNSFISVYQRKSCLVIYDLKKFIHVYNWQSCWGFTTPKKFIFI